MKSVINSLNTEDFTRVRIGIGKPKIGEDLINYVITRMPKEDEKILEGSTKKAAEAVLKIITQGVDKAMNDVNLRGE